MSKKIFKNTALAMAILVSCSAWSFEPMLNKGTQEFGIQGVVDFDYRYDYLVTLNTSYGYFVKDNWEVGGVLDINASGNSKTYGIGAFTEYNFSNSTSFIPYVGVAAQFVSAKTDDDPVTINKNEKIDTNAGQFKFSLGLKYFINPSVAINAEVNYTTATDDIVLDNDKLKKSFTRFFVGTRFYF
ncbi:hypothetical protein ACH42_01925 [Endozoicomonas sp. (ex Bugula neritina AB1)]|nr:hypothetical protein ACH42_01925 [Endozoicomonas sp. (ex Bugula neritina AB1)]